MITLIQRLGSETQLKDDFIDALIEKIKENPGSCTDVWLASKYGFPSIEEHKKTAEKLSKVLPKASVLPICAAAYASMVVPISFLLPSVITNRPFSFA